MRVGVIGVGSIGEHHVRNYAAIKEVELAGIYDTDFLRASAIAEKYDTHPFKSLNELLSEVEAVSIAVPTARHKEVALAAIDKGLHLLVEKPIAVDLKEAEEIINEARKKKIKLMVGHVERFNPALTTLQKIIHHDEIIYLEAQRLSSYPASGSEQVSVVLDLMIHDIDLILSLIKSPIKKINSLASKVRSSTEEITCAQILFENGVIAILTASRLTQKKVRSLTVTQQDAYITADFLTQEVLIHSQLSSEYVTNKHIRYKELGAVEIPYVHKGEPLALELENFVNCLKNGGDPFVSGDDGKRALEVALDVLSSAFRACPEKESSVQKPGQEYVLKPAVLKKN